MKKAFTNTLLFENNSHTPSSRSVSVRDKKIMSFPKFVIGNLNLVNKQAAEVPDKNTRGRQYKKAFTLIELLVVVLIISILAAVALPQYEKAVMKSRYSTLMSTVESLAAAEEVYYLANQSYTNDFEALGVQPSGCTLSVDKTKCTFDWGSCTLDSTSDDSVACVNTTTLQNGYAHYFTYGKDKVYGRSCWALSGEDKYGKLCEQMGGTKRINFGDAVCPPHGACALYTLD